MQGVSVWAFVVLLSVWAAAGDLTAALAGPVSQDGPTLTITPASGPCDATVTVSGTGFPADTEVFLELGRPHSGGTMGEIAAGPD